MIDVTTYILKSFFILLLFRSITAELQYVPPSQYIEVVEFKTYKFGFEETDNDPNVTECHYSSDTGINGSFNVLGKGNETSTSYNNVRANVNVIRELGPERKCQVEVSNVADNGPKQWTVRAIDENSGSHTVIINVAFFYGIPLLKDAIDSYESASFVQYLQTDIKFSSCKLTFEGGTVDLPLDSPTANVFLAPYSEEAESLANKISPLRQGLCGFKFTNASLTVRTQWTLTGVDEQGTGHGAVFYSQINKKPDTFVLSREGDGARMSCGCQLPGTVYYSYILSPMGRLVFSGDKTKCTYSLKTVKVEDLGVWECFVLKRDSLAGSLHYTAELTAKDTPVVETWVNETELYVNIGCQVVNFSSPIINYCKVTAPNSETFNLEPGFATSRYLSIGTNTLQGRCEMQIEKPLQDIDKGIWRCEMKHQSGIYTGGIVKIGIEETPDYPKHLKLSTQIDQPLTIRCDVPYSSEYCTIQGPDGTNYPIESESETRLGRCSTHVTTNVTHNGTWSCSFAREIGIPNDIITVEVTIGEVLVYYSHVEANYGDDAKLMCSSGGYPLKYCQFIAPNGTSYYIHNHQKSATISYHGDGYESGDCGIIIANVQSSDSGTWRCVTKIGLLDQNEVSARIAVEVSSPLLRDPNIATGIGIAVGVVVVTTIVGVVAVQRWRRRRHTEMPGSSTNARRVNDGDNISYNSETDIFSLMSPPRSYTNPVIVSEDQPNHAHQL